MVLDWSNAKNARDYGILKDNIFAQTREKGPTLNSRRKQKLEGYFSENDVFLNSVITCAFTFPTVTLVNLLTNFI